MDGWMLTSVCWDLDRDSRISSRIRSDRSEATFNLTSLLETEEGPDCSECQLEPGAPGDQHT